MVSADKLRWNGRVARRHQALICGIVIIIALVVRSIYIFMPFDSDMEMFVYMGRLVTQGKTVGVDLLDNKLPTVGLLMFLPYLLLGSAWWAYGVMSVLMTAATVLALTASAGETDARDGQANGRVARGWFVAAIAAVQLSVPVFVASAFKLEHVVVCFSSLAALATVKCLKNASVRHAVLLGLCGGLAAMAKPSGLAVMVAAGVALLWSKELTSKIKIKLALSALAGLAVPTAVCALYICTTSAGEGVVVALRQTADYAKHSTWVPAQVIEKLLTATLIIGGPIGVCWLSGRTLSNKVSRPESIAFTSALAVRIFIGVWLLLEVSAVLLQARLYGYHLLPVVPPAVLICALVYRQTDPVRLLATLLPVLMFSVAIATRQVMTYQPPVDRLAAIQFVEEHALKDDLVWMDDGARLLVEAGLQSGSRVPLTFIFSNSDDAPTAFGDILLNDFQQRRPRWVVQYRDIKRYIDWQLSSQVEYARNPERGRNFRQAWEKIDGYISRHYTTRQTFGRFKVMMRRDDEPNQ